MCVDTALCDKIDELIAVSTATNGYLWYYVVFFIVFLFCKMIWNICKDWIL